MADVLRQATYLVVVLANLAVVNAVRLLTQEVRAMRREMRRWR